MKLNTELNSELTLSDLACIAIIVIGFIFLTLKVDKVKTNDYASIRKTEQSKP